MNKKVTVKSKKTNVFIMFFLILVALLQIFPLYWMFTFSLKNNHEIFGGNIIGLPQEWEWENYIHVFTNANMGKYLFNSVVVTTITILITLLLCSMVTYAIVRLKWKLNQVVYCIFLIGMMISIHSVLLPLFVNLNPVLDTYWALILPYVAFAMPTTVLIMVGALEALPIELEEAAFVDGASIYGIFFKIILPLLKPILATSAILVFLSAWNEMMLAITFLNGEKYKTITVGILDMVGKYSTKWGYVGAGLVVATIPTLVMFILLSKQVQESLAAGAVKG